VSAPPARVEEVHVKNRLRDAVFASEARMETKSVMYALIMRADDQALSCWPSIPRIARDAGMEEKTARAHLQLLVAAGAISRRDRADASGQCTPEWTIHERDLLLHLDGIPRPKRGGAREGVPKTVPVPDMVPGTKDGTTPGTKDGTTPVPKTAPESGQGIRSSESGHLGDAGEPGRAGGVQLPPDLPALLSAGPGSDGCTRIGRVDVVARLLAVPVEDTRSLLAIPRASWWGDRGKCFVSGCAGLRDALERHLQARWGLGLGHYAEPEQAPAPRRLPAGGFHMEFRPVEADVGPSDAELLGLGLQACTDVRQLLATGIPEDAIRDLYTRRERLHA